MEQYFFLKFSLYSLSGRLFVNDLTSMSFFKPSGFKVTLPINYLLKYGINTFRFRITMNIAELEGDGFSIRMELIEKNSFSSKEYKTISSNYWDANQIKSNAFQQDYAFEISLEPKFPIVNWHYAQPLELPNLSYLVLKYFERLHALFESKNIEEILKVTLIRDENIAKSLYADITEKNEDTRAGLMEILNEPSWELQKFQKELFKVSFEAERKLVTLEDQNSFPVIRYLNKNNDLIRFPFYLGISPGERTLSVLA